MCVGFVRVTAAHARVVPMSLLVITTLKRCLTMVPVMRSLTPSLGVVHMRIQPLMSPWRVPEMRRSGQLKPLPLGAWENLSLPLILLLLAV